MGRMKKQNVIIMRDGRVTKRNGEVHDQKSVICEWVGCRVLVACCLAKIKN